MSTKQRPDWQLPSDDGDDAFWVVLAVIVGVPWVIDVAAIIGARIWCG